MKDCLKFNLLNKTLDKHKNLLIFIIIMFINDNNVFIINLNFKIFLKNTQTLISNKLKLIFLKKFTQIKRLIPVCIEISRKWTELTG